MIPTGIITNISKEGYCMGYFRSAILAVAAVAAVAATPALAQEEKGPITISGSVALVSDYRFRGISQTDRDMAIQGGISIAHESGFYVATWASNLAGWGTFGGANMELDLIGGFRTTLGNATLDGGLLWYMYPGGADNSDLAELYFNVSGTRGPVTLKGGIAYAPKQDALANVSGTPFSRGQKEDNLYLYGDTAIAIPSTPLTLKGHLGYSDGNPGIGPNGTTLTPGGNYWDWTVGVEATYRNLTLNVSYVDTDITARQAAPLMPAFSEGGDGKGSIAGGAAVVSLTATF